MLNNIQKKMVISGDITLPDSKLLITAEITVYHEGVTQGYFNGSNPDGMYLSGNWDGNSITNYNVDNGIVTDEDMHILEQALKDTAESTKEVPETEE